MLADLWAGLPPQVQDAVTLMGLLAPGLIVGAVVLHGYSPAALVRAMLVRFRAANLVFIGLIAASVAISVGLTAQERALRQGTTRAADKFDLVVAAPGSEITVMLAAVYLQASDMPLLDGAAFERIATSDHVDLAAPIAFGDSYEGAAVVGTTAQFVRYLGGELAEGRIFTTGSEAVAGASAPVVVGMTFDPAHGTGPVADEHAHEGSDEPSRVYRRVVHEGYTVVGRMAPTGSPWDRAILVPIEGVWEVHGLSNGHAPADSHRIGPPFDTVYFPGTPAVIVHANELWANYALKSALNTDDSMAFFPGTVLAQLHSLMGDIRRVVSVIATVTRILVTISVLAGLMILTQIFARNLALLRAIGAPPRFIFAVVWSHSAVLILTGAVIGLGLGYLAALGFSRAISEATDVALTAAIGWSEAQMLAAFVSLTLVLALLPAWAAMRRPVLRDLRA